MASELKVFVTQSCPTLCDPWTGARILCPCDFPGKILEWVAIPFSNYDIWGHQENNTKIYNNDGYEIESYNLKHYKAWSKRK